MLVTIIGLVLFLGIHSVRIVAPQWREERLSAMGGNAWRGLYSAVSIIGFVLILWGYSLWRPVAADLWFPPAWLSHVAALLMLVSAVFMGVYIAPGGRMKAALKNPMLLSVKTWAVAHLLVNGDAASVVLFGAFLVWGVMDLVSVKKRGTPPPVAGPARGDILAVITGLVIYCAFVFFVHEWWIGVDPLAMMRS